MTQAAALAQYGSTGVSQGFKNRIINGNMVIDQRNAGASVSITGGSTTYTVDRWAIFENGSMAFSAQRSTTAPTGFINSLLVTTTTGAAAGADDRSQLFQRIEGFNTADLNWGTANAKTVTLSFWVRSSLTGQFGGSLQNSNQDRSYPFSFTISSANTFEYKTITVAGDTSGTWLTDNSTGIQVLFDLGMGSNLLGTAGAWASADYRGATGDTKLSGTTNATLYLTGVQLEVGSTATSFDYRPYSTELNLCERYCRRYGDGLLGIASSSTGVFLCPNFAPQMRATPTVTLADNSVKITDNYASDYTSSGSTLPDTTISAFGGRINVNGFTGLTTGRVYEAYDNTNGFFFVISAEL